jgi:GNAT superfamily N-acetyltransferase
MRAWNLADPQIEFVFGRVDDSLRAELQTFWAKNTDDFRAEMNAIADFHGKISTPLAKLQRPLHRQPGAIARSGGGKIIGIVFVVLREVSDDTMLGTYAYFQRMYIAPKARNLKLANRLFTAFLNGFERAAESRDHRAKALMSINNNPGLQTAYVRRYFVRLGFRLLGDNKFGNEVWTKKLQTRFVF